MKPLLIGPDEVAALHKLRDIALAHPVDMPGLSARLKDPAQKAIHMARMGAQTVLIPYGFLVTYSVEDGHPCGRARHMSMSVEDAGRVPNLHAVQGVASILGFEGTVEETCTCWLEDLQGHGKAVNVVQPMDAP
jgi:hypothetical protein